MYNLWLAVACVKGKKFIIHIENKIRAAEGENQTNREWEDLQGRAEELGIPAANVHAIFLTLDCSRPQNENFRPVGWSRIARVLERFADEAQPPEVKLFTRHYAAAVRKLAVTKIIAKETPNGKTEV